ncbi:MAG: P-loop NTPase [Clostridia bacterium]|nr:P-loop NTPase [Clostridia bacterium]
MKCGGKILFSSLKGGVGKSTSACLVATALAEDGYNTVIVDLDFRSRSLDLILGVSDKVLFTFDDYLLERCSADAVLIPVTGYAKQKRTHGEGKLLLCPAPSETAFEAAGEDAYDRIPEALLRLCEESGADYVVCDTGADSRIPLVVGNGFAELAIVVSEQSKTAIRAAETTAARLADCAKVREVRLLINNFNINAARHGGRAGILDMIDGCSVRCIGVIPEDRGMPERQDAGLLPHKASPVIPASRNIARRIQGIETPLFTGMKKERRRTVL